MALKTGTRLGPYEITAPIGSGGMGEVYRATDTKLKRDVAIKVLPDDVTQNRERLARFRREAELLASLNHPNIAAIYGLEESGGVPCLVLELVSGETLTDRLATGPLPVNESLRIAQQIASALEAAHESGVIHRDIKPQNIKLTEEGLIKVLDFGLAKAFHESDTDSSRSPTITANATREGVLLGTAHYMSPEQARGRQVDKRTDIWSFGCVLYELLACRRAFAGRTASDAIAEILRREPDWNALPAQTPRKLRDLLARCLTKEPKRRLRDIGDARNEIEDLMSGPSERRVRTPGLPGLRRGPGWAAAVVALALTAALVWAVTTWSTRPTPQLPVRLTVNLPPGQQLTGANFSSSFALSPDGTLLVYVAVGSGGRQLYLRRVDQFEATSIPGTEAASAPFFSPDGRWIGFAAHGELLKVPVAGGAPMSIGKATVRPLGASWGADDTVIYTPGIASGLWRVSSSGGEPEVLTTPDAARGEVGHVWPHVLPGGRDVIFTIQTGHDWQIAVLSLETGDRKVLLRQGRAARYLATGHLAFIEQKELRVVPFDLARRAVMGSPLSIIGDAGMFAVSGNGSLAYLPGTAAGGGSVVLWVDRAGEVITPLTEERGNYMRPRISPDGDRVAVVAPHVTGDINVWILNVKNASRTRLTVEGNINNFPVWTPDGTSILFNSTRTNQGIYWKATDGSGSAQQLLKRTHPQLPASVSPDGKTLFFTELNPDTKEDIWVIPLDGDRDPSPLLVSRFRERAPRLSPDGRWLAYVSDESGRDEVYIQPYPGVGGRRMVSTAGGGEPVWAANGRELFFRNGDGMLAVSMTGDPPRAGAPQLLFEGQYNRDTAFGHPDYDVADDGERFLMLLSDQEGPTRLRIVLNWFDELKRRMAAE